ncbi:MAG: CobW family GTP-binding protein [Pseudanabaenaceae cyanobacterium]
MISIDIPKRGMPVTIITGFLGSGKTTLLNHILQNQQNLKVAVLVNEFGDINIDSQLLVGVEEDMVELSNGCICCTINDRLIDAVYNVLERSDRIDYMILETTGVADPLPIALTFLGTELKHLTRLDSILTVVDAEQFNEDHFDSEAAYQQIAYGDIIILNKTDLVTEIQLEALEGFINKVKPKGRILRSQYGKVPLPLILDVQMDQTALAQLSATADHTHHHDHEHDHHHSHHLENDGFISISFQSDRPFDLDKFQFFLDRQLPVNVFRAKGLLNFQGIAPTYIFQLSGKRYELRTDDRDLPKRNQMVLIGRNLDTNDLRLKLENCLA